MNEENNVVKKKCPIVTIILVIVALLIGIGGTYFVIDKNPTIITKSSINNKEVNENNEEETNVDNSTNKTVVIGFENGKCLNSTNSYNLVSNNKNFGVNVTVGSNKKDVTLGINTYIVNNMYNFGWMTPNAESAQYESTNTYKFDKEIEDVLIGGFGQTTGRETILFLMKDGTVQYIPIKKALQSDEYKSQSKIISSYGTLDDVKDIVKFYEANSSGGYATILAQKSDGTFYDLSINLQNTGNY